MGALSIAGPLVAKKISPSLQRERYKLTQISANSWGNKACGRIFSTLIKLGEKKGSVSLEVCVLQGLLAQVISSHWGRLAQTPAVFLEQRLKGTNNQSQELSSLLAYTPRT